MRRRRRPPIRSIRSASCSINDVYVADTLSDGQGGLARVATVRNRLADQGPVLFVLAGDLLSPSLLSKYYGGRQMVEALNAAKLDYATFGNHEFELELDTLVARIEASTFNWLSSNCTLAGRRAVPQGAALGHRADVGSQGRAVRPHPAGQLPAVRPLLQPRQRRAPGHRYAQPPRAPI